MTTPHVTLTLEPKSVPGLIAFVLSVIGKMAASRWFPNPSPSLASVNTNVDVLQELEAKSKTPEITKQRDSAKTTVQQDLRHLRDYVQLIVEKNVEHGSEIIASAGMTEGHPTTRHKPALEAAETGEACVAALIASAIDGARSYYWQLSLNGTDWTDLPETAQANTTVSGLPLHTTVYFRMAALTRAGKQAYGTSVPYFVL